MSDKRCIPVGWSGFCHHPG
ncbi:hypothetical protein GQQ23_03940 [Pantoea agglomerans]|nr:hypothetical protein [Pantoea agglomerans]